jgi:2,3-dihydroxy-p-cumate/2,3-dihydroxybenzoate 3,4-dioxygenase
MRLRSAELEVTDRATAVEFLKHPWGLIDVGTRNGTTYLRGTEDHAYVLAMKQAGADMLASATFTGSQAEIEALFGRVQKAGMRHTAWVNEYDEPGRGAGFSVEGPEGQPWRFVAEKDRTEKLPADAAHPLQLAHVVFNTLDREAGTRTLVDVFGFKLSDRTRTMNFIRCNSLHHSVAYVGSTISSLNHIAFEMISLEAVMRGIGRVMDTGRMPAWAPGRHGPGNNVFAYFIAPFGACVEYTADVQRVDDNYRTGQPEDWKWPPNRIDQWGVAKPDKDLLEQSGEKFRFRRIAA